MIKITQGGQPPATDTRTGGLFVVPSDNLRARRLDVQGLRGIAVLMVVAFHAGLPLPGGFVGVDAFFVISGFVITAMLRREWLTTGRVGLGAFYWRRFQRLAPALALMVTATVLVSHWLLPPLGAQQNAAQAGAGAMLWSANVVIERATGGYFDVSAALNPLLHTWSLAVEEQFYLLLPVIVLAGWKFGRSLGRAWVAGAAVGAMAVGSIVLLWAGTTGPLTALLPAPVVGFYSPVGRVWEFAAGVMIALTAERMRIRPAVAALLGIVGLGLLLAAALLIDGTMLFPGLATALPVLGTTMIILAGVQWTNPTGRALSTRPLVWIGDRSYAWYLWHWPFIVFAGLLMPGRPGVVLVAAALSLLVAAASYRWFEDPVRRMRIPIRRRVAVFAIALAIPVLVCGGVLVRADTGGDPLTRQLREATTTWHLGFVSGCETATPQSARAAGECTWNASAPGPPFYLVGDSTADHFSEAMLDAATAAGSPLIISTTSACPLVDGWFDWADRPAQFNERCRDYQSGTLAYLRTATPGVVVLSQVGDYWTSAAAKFGPQEAEATNDPAAKLRLYEQRLDAIVAELVGAGHSVLLVQTVPQFPDYEPQRCTPSVIAGGECLASLPLSAAAGQDAPIKTSVDAAGSQPGATVLDLRDVLCGDACHTVRDGVVLYKDAGHLSVAGSRLLGPTFSDAIARLQAG